MTTGDATERLEALRASAGRLAELVPRLSSDQLRQQAYPTEWKVADVLSHLGSGAVITCGRIDANLGGEPQDPHPIWDEWNAKTPEERAAGVLAADRAMLDRLASLTPEEQARFRATIGAMEIGLAGFVGLRLNEHAMHSWDVAVTLDPAATIPADAVAHLVDTVGLITGFAAKPTGADRTITVRTTEPEGQVEITLKPDGVTVSPGGPAGDADLELPAEAYVRLVYGRLDPGHTPPFQGDEADLAELRRAFPGF